MTTTRGREVLPDIGPSLTVFVSLLEVQDQKQAIEQQGPVARQLVHRPGLHAAGSVWELPPIASPVSGSIETLDVGGSPCCVLRPLGEFVHLTGGRLGTADTFTTDEVFDTAYLLGTVPDGFPVTEGVVVGLYEVYRRFVQRGRLAVPVVGCPRLVGTPRVSWGQLVGQPDRRQEERLDGFVVQVVPDGVATRVPG